MNNNDFNKIKKDLNLTDDFFLKADELKQKITRSRVFFGLSVLVVLSAIMFRITRFSNEGFMILVLVGSVLVLICGKRLKKDKEVYADYIKDNVVTSMFVKEFDHINFKPQDGFSKDYIRSTKMYPMGNVFSSNDLLMGSYKGVGFTQADVLIQDQSTDSEGHTTTTTLFKGRWLIYDFNKEFKGNLQLRSNYGRVLFKNKKVNSWFNKNNLESIRYENQDFNDMFNAYTDNAHDAYYIITPHMMESMLALNNALSCEIVISFIDNKLHIAIYNNEDAFEIGTRDIDMNFINQVDREIELIKFVVDGLDLSDDLFKQ